MQILSHCIVVYCRRIVLFYKSLACFVFALEKNINILLGIGTKLSLSYNWNWYKTSCFPPNTIQLKNYIFHKIAFHYQYTTTSIIDSDKTQFKLHTSYIYIPIRICNKIIFFQTGKWSFSRNYCQRTDASVRFISLV